VPPIATVTTLPAPIASPTLAPVPTPTNLPAGWAVLVAPHFSLGYPPGWTPQTDPQPDGSVLYTITPPSALAPPVIVTVQANVSASDVEGSHCVPANGANGDPHSTTLAGLPMVYTLSGEGQLDRLWGFANAQRTVFGLSAGDAQSGSAVQAQDDTIFATFRPDDATPWGC
jgi:hypothetical protein